MLPKLSTSDFHLPYDPALINRAKALRLNPTAAEKKLWQFLKTFHYRVLRQRPIHHFIVDFYCPRLRLVIEVDGDVHFTETAAAYDAERTQVLEGYGLQVIRFTNEQVMGDFEAVCQKIGEMIPP
ncbi:MAG: endonuclease domain-containing protein [Cyanobacteria bacterium RM1_2_2]|nr:endonuclease domain-containing protein [Cyanobacteria bacterium RM1_2_2]